MVERIPPAGAPPLHAAAWRCCAHARQRAGTLPDRYAELARLTMENRRLRRTVARLRFDRRVLFEALLRDVR